MNDRPTQILKMLAQAYGLVGLKQLKTIDIGLINQTYAVDKAYIVQRLNPIFDPRVNEDIAEICPRLLEYGIPVPEILITQGGRYWVDGVDFGLEAGTWRVMTMLKGQSLQKVENKSQVQALARSLGSFHRALVGFEHSFKQSRPSVHDIQRHLSLFDAALEDKTGHAYWSKLKQLRAKVEQLLQCFDPQAVLRTERLSIVHGDPKISNFLFDGEQISGVIDLDTLSYSSFACDLGDAMRSWANPKAEHEAPEADMDYVGEILETYLTWGPRLSASERAKLPLSAPAIALELSLRFGRDALCEDYFAFDPRLGHAKHSFMRAKAQIELAEAFLDAML